MPRKLTVKFVAIYDCGTVIENRLNMRLGKGVGDIVARAIQHEGKCNHFVRLFGSVVGESTKPRIEVYAKTKR